MRRPQSALQLSPSRTPRLESLTSLLVCRPYQFLKVANMCFQALLHGAFDMLVVLNIVRTTPILRIEGLLLSGDR